VPGSHGAADAWPLVSVVIPVLNEERFIDACLRAVLAQDYPATLMEIVVVDGVSSDRTAALVRAIAAEDSRIRLLTNPKQKTPTSMNLGVAAARGQVVVRIDGHSLVARDHVRRNVEFLQRSGADHVGGLMKAQGHNTVASAIALALSSPFGVGNAVFRYTDREQDLDTVPFGAYRRDTLLRLGGFDERFSQGQDSELDFRITLSGGRVRINPDIRTEYFCRDSLPRLAQQFFRYGRAKAFIFHKHGALPSPRALAPAALLSTVMALTLAAPIFRPARRALAVLLGIYALACTVAGIRVAARQGWRHTPLLPIIFAVLHFSHGAGFLAGLPRLATRRPADRLRGSLTAADESSLSPGRALHATH
jgi:succinoglycan biosynthesis protein ExoA